MIRTDKQVMEALGWVVEQVQEVLGNPPAKYIVREEELAMATAITMCEMFLDRLGLSMKRRVKFYTSRTETEELDLEATETFSRMLPALAALGVVKEEQLGEWGLPQEKISAIAKQVREEMEADGHAM